MGDGQDPIGKHAKLFGVPKPQRSSLYQFVETKLDSDPMDWLKARRSEGKSWDSIAWELSTLTNRRISAETLRLWATEDAPS